MKAAGADSAVVEPVFVMYCALLEERVNSLAFKVCLPHCNSATMSVPDGTVGKGSGSAASLGVCVRIPRPEDKVCY